MTFKARIFQSWTIQSQRVEGVEKPWVEEFMVENFMVENFMVENFMIETSWLKIPATLYKAGFHNVDGVDYSEQALALAHKLAKDSDIPDLNFFVSIFF